MRSGSRILEAARVGRAPARLDSRRLSDCFCIPSAPSRMDGRDALRDEDAAQRCHRDGFARARLQHQAGNRDPRCADVGRRNPGVLLPSCGTGGPHRRVQRTGNVDMCEVTAEIGHCGSDPGRQIGRRNPVFSHGLVQPPNSCQLTLSTDSWHQLGRGAISRFRLCARRHGG